MTPEQRKILLETATKVNGLNTELLVATPAAKDLSEDQQRQLNEAVTKLLQANAKILEACKN